MNVQPPAVGYCPDTLGSDFDHWPEFEPMPEARGDPKQPKNQVLAKSSPVGLNKATNCSFTATVAVR